MSLLSHKSTSIKNIALFHSVAISDFCQLSRASIFLFFSFFLVFYILFFPLPFSPLILPYPQQSPPCCPCLWVPFHFCPMPPPSHLPPTVWALSLFSIYESVSILHVSSVCSLDSTYGRNHMVFGFLWLAYFP